MKTLKDFTQEIKNKISEYKNRCVNDLHSGIESKNWKRENTVSYVEYVYALAKQKNKPIVIIANSPNQYKIFYNLLFNNSLNQKYNFLVNFIWLLKNNKKIVNSELDSELYSELDSKLDSELNSELDSELYSELNSELDSELDSELYSKLDSELYSKLRSELGSELGSKLRSELYSELSSELMPVKYHYLFIISEYSRVYLTWYYFIMKEFNLSCKKEKELTWLYNNINNANIAKGFFCEKIVLILRMPNKILRNEIGFHSTKEPAIQYNDNEKYHYLNGRNMPEWIFTKYKNKTLTFNDFNNEKNEDIRAGIITLIKENGGNKELMKFLNAEIVDKQIINHNDEYSETLVLYKTKEKFPELQNSKNERNQPYAWLGMTCPSTKQSYLIDTCPLFTNVIECAKWHRPQQIPKNIPYQWQSAN